MKYKSKEGVTLLVLIVTITVLLILAGLSIAITTRGDGIFEKANSVVDSYNKKQE